MYAHDGCKDSELICERESAARCAFEGSDQSHESTADDDRQDEDADDEEREVIVSLEIAKSSSVSKPDEE
jgi:hypothetical protein